jgi:multicomponent Na+:H+ antiporter subunit E
MKSILYICWLLSEIAKASIAVTKLIWQREPELSPLIEWVATSQKTDVKRVVFANSITLTPGTITVAVENQRLLVHSLTKVGLRDLEGGNMDGKICKL